MFANKVVHDTTEGHDKWVMITLLLFERNIALQILTTRSHTINMVRPK